jgi:hypothetical protein
MSNPSVYCALLAKGNIQPNFYCSDEFRIRAKIEEIVTPGYVYWKWDDGALVHPPLYTNGEIVKIKLDCIEEVWSDFTEYKPAWGFPKFLDYEYLFDPQSFLKMEGGNWQVFRKNCRKWPRRFGDKASDVLKYEWVSTYIKERGSNRLWEELWTIFMNWVKGKPDEEEIQGDEIMLSYLRAGENRKVLYNYRNGDIYGVNIWDFNYRYINYRFTFNPPENFLSEYMRVLFYTDPHILKQGRLVNDGGCLGSESLKKFKEKMNPLWTRRVMSWEKADEMG